MESTNKKWGVFVIALVAVLFFALGYLLYPELHTPKSATHMMPDGTMMRNDGMGAMEGMMHDMNASLEGKTGDAFDKEFLDQMIVHHEGAVAMAQQVLAVSRRPELLSLARAIISAQETEIQQMQQWRVQWFAR